MDKRPRVFPLLAGALFVAIGLSSVLVETGALTWALGAGVVLLVVGGAALGGLFVRHG